MAGTYPPVVVLPGIMASTLSLDDNVIWPPDDWTDLRFLEVLDPAHPRSDDLVPTAVAEDVPIITSLIRMEGYGGLLKFLEKIGYQRGRTCSRSRTTGARTTASAPRRWPNASGSGGASWGRMPGSPSSATAWAAWWRATTSSVWTATPTWIT